MEHTIFEWIFTGAVLAITGYCVIMSAWYTTHVAVILRHLEKNLPEEVARYKKWKEAQISP